MMLCPLTIKEARDFVARHHRHHRAPRGGLWAVGVADDGEIVGVAIVGRPCARLLGGGYVAEVTRVCVIEGARNACSMLYGACWRAARSLGYRRLITYTLANESGDSLRGAGWTCLGERGGGSWDRVSRPRVDLHPTQVKIGWECALPRTGRAA
ncbi:XF1762 family protein [Pendulispora albinea]|uniref:XF1762 family protein n=1 Tax=Pendulispora albinea TaxID=2741071 RepID=UPI00374E0D05